MPDPFRFNVPPPAPSHPVAAVVDVIAIPARVLDLVVDNPKGRTCIGFNPDPSKLYAAISMSPTEADTGLTYELQEARSSQPAQLTIGGSGNVSLLLPQHLWSQGGDEEFPRRPVELHAERVANELVVFGNGAIGLNNTALMGQAHFRAHQVCISDCVVEATDNSLFHLSQAFTEPELVEELSVMLHGGACAYVGADESRTFGLTVTAPDESCFTVDHSGDFAFRNTSESETRWTSRSGRHHGAAVGARVESISARPVLTPAPPKDALARMFVRG